MHFCEISKELFSLIYTGGILIWQQMYQICYKRCFPLDNEKTLFW